MILLTAVFCAFVLDLLFGDPMWMPHPVVMMGKVLSFLERQLRRRFPKTPRGEFAGGLLTAVLLPLGTLLLSSAVCVAAWKVHRGLFFAVQTFWCWQCLAVRGLRTESERVRGDLERSDLASARTSVARIVGRDTQSLSVEGVTKATVETIAENFSDGVAAPLLYMLIGGAPLALVYKSINTMDSMIGYKNERFLYFGRAAAKLDDAANYLPSRIAALFWIAAAFVTGHDAKQSFVIWRRDCRNHASPNSAQTEAACAGALGVQLAGPAYYFGERYEKPTIGDHTRDIVPADIRQTIRMLYAASVLALLVGLCLRFGAVWLLGGIR